MESKSSWSRFEKIALVVAAALFLVSFTMYFTHFPLRSYLFGVVEEGGDVRIGQTATAIGDLKRQRIGTAEFADISTGAPLYDLDTVVTGSQSKAELEIDGGARISVEPNSMIRLAFDTRYTLAGVTRTPRVQVLQGQVEAVAGSKPVVIQSTNQLKKLDAAKPNQPKPSVTAGAATPRPMVSPSESPSPTPSPSPSPSPSESPAIPETEGKIEIVEPKREQSFSVDPKKLVARVPMRWKLPEDFPTVVESIHVEVARLYKEKRGVQREMVVEQSQAPGEPGSIGGLDMDANRAGRYEWRVFVPGTKLEAKSVFNVSQEFEDLILKDPLIGGRVATNNRYSGSLLRDFSIVVGWHPYVSAKPNAPYLVRFFDAPKGGRVVDEIRTEDLQVEINRGKVPRGRVYYEVSTPAAAGFIARSKRGEVTFLFDPPLLTLPENNAVVSIQDIQARGGTLLLTWQKTNFTERYELELATDPSFSRVALTHQTDENYFPVKASTAGKYYWRVRAQARGGSFSEYSKIQSFSVR